MKLRDHLRDWNWQESKETGERFSSWKLDRPKLQIPIAIFPLEGKHSRGKTLYVDRHVKQWLNEQGVRAAFFQDRKARIPYISDPGDKTKSRKLNLACVIKRCDAGYRTEPKNGDWLRLTEANLKEPFPDRKVTHPSILTPKVPSARTEFESDAAHDPWQIDSPQFEPEIIDQGELEIRENTELFFEKNIEREQDERAHQDSLTRMGLRWRSSRRVKPKFNNEDEPPEDFGEGKPTLKGSSLYKEFAKFDRSIALSTKQERKRREKELDRDYRAHDYAQKQLQKKASKQEPTSEELACLVAEFVACGGEIQKFPIKPIRGQHAEKGERGKDGRLRHWPLLRNRGDDEHLNYTKRKGLKVKEKEPKMLEEQGTAILKDGKERT